VAELYPWLVFAHLVGVVLFALGHGGSVFVAFRIRAETDPAIIASQLAASRMSLWPMYGGLLLLGIGGLGAAWAGDFLLAPWVVASYVVLAVVLVVMWAVASPYYMGIRKALEPEGGAPPIAVEDLSRRLDNRRPEILAAVGGIGLLILTWLMVLKPG
jgi:hypothetical protein